MSIPYYSTGQNTFNFPRVNDKSYVEFPFQDLGDRDSKIYHVNCTMRKDGYRKDQIYSFALAGLSSGNGTYTLVPDALIGTRQYYEATIGGNIHRVYNSSSKWYIIDSIDSDPLFIQTDSKEYPFPWNVPAWTALSGSGTPAFTTFNVIPSLDVTLDASNVKALGLPVDFYDSNAYYIGDHNHSVDGDMISFDRQFANIPSANSVNSGTEIYTFPGLPVVAGTGSAINITNMSSADNVVTLTTASAHGMSAGDLGYVFFKVTGTLYGGTRTFYVSGNKEALTGTTGSTFKFRYHLDLYTLVSGTIKPNATNGRRSVSRTSPTEIVREYFLPGVSSGISNPQDIAVEAPFGGYDYATGSQITTLSSSSTPTADEYVDILNSDGYLVMHENVKRWKGNILVKESKQIRAL